MEVLVGGGLVRLVQAALAAGPTLLVGLIVASVMRKLLGPRLTYQAFGGGSWRSLPQAWGWGMLLPVCSLGVIPIAYEMRRAGLSGGAILAFALTAPLFNPLSLLYGLTLASPTVIIAYAVGSLIVVTVVGLVWDRLFPGSAEPPATEGPDRPGLKRVFAVMVHAARQSAGPLLGYSLIGLSGAVVLSTAFRAGSLTDSMAHNDPTAPLLMLGVALPAYATPLSVMQQLGSMFLHGNSAGAAYVLLSLGAGANLGLIAWAIANYGLRRAMAFLAVFVAVVMGIAYGLEAPLYTPGGADHAHTHAFDGYANPFDARYHSGWNDLRRLAGIELRDTTELFEIIGLAAVGVLVLLGGLLRAVDPQQRLEAYLAARKELPEGAEASVLDKDVPPVVLGGVAVAGLVAFSVVGCFIYYPKPEQTLQDLQMVRADALTFAIQQNATEAVPRIEDYMELTRKLQIGYYLRHGRPDEFQSLRAEKLRDWLEKLKDALEAGQFDRVRQLNSRIFAAHARCSQAYRQEGS